MVDGVARRTVVDEADSREVGIDDAQIFDVRPVRVTAVLVHPSKVWSVSSPDSLQREVGKAHRSKQPSADHPSPSISAIQPINHRVRILGQRGGKYDDRVPR